MRKIYSRDSQPVLLLKAVSLLAIISIVLPASSMFALNARAQSDVQEATEISAAVQVETVSETPSLEIISEEPKTETEPTEPTVEVQSLGGGGGNDGGNGGFFYEVTVDQININGLDVSIEGGGFADPYIGNCNHINEDHDVEVNWGDGNVDHTSNHFFVDPDGCGGNTEKTFEGEWSNEHTYSEPGLYTVTVKLYHGQPGGNEASSLPVSQDISVKGEPPFEAFAHVYKFLSGGFAGGIAYPVVESFPMYESYGGEEGAGGNYFLNDGNDFYHMSTAVTIPGLYSTYEITNDGKNESNVVPIGGECTEFHCPQDINFDGEIDVVDLCIVVNTWSYIPESLEPTEAQKNTCFGQPIYGLTGDTNDDGVVNVNDLLDVINHWGSCPFQYQLAGYTVGDTYEEAQKGELMTVSPELEMYSDKHIIVWNTICEFTPPNENQPPVVTILGDNPFEITQGETFTDPGATATDPEQGDLTSEIVVTGSVDTGTIGSYVLTYTVTDNGGLSDSEDRTVNVVGGSTPPPPPPPPQQTGGSGGTGGVGGHISGNGGIVLSSQGEVLGASTCSAYLNEYIGAGKNNSAAEVSKLQTFLNKHLGLNLPVNGVYGPMTQEAVNQFQITYRDQILKPWVDAGLHENTLTPTAYVYITTRRWINMLECPALGLPMPNIKELAMI